MFFASGGFDPLASAGPAMVWAVVLVFVFLECALIIGLFLPGDSMLITAGIALAATSAGPVHIWGLAIGAMVAAVAGNQVGYLIGHRARGTVLARRNGKYINARNLHRVNVLLDKHGFWAVCVSRWVPWVRTLCPLVAGSARMNHRKYTIASALGAVVWAPVLLMIGYYAGEWINGVPWLMPAVLATMGAGLVVGTVLGIRHYTQEMSRPSEPLAVESVEHHHSSENVHRSREHHRHGGQRDG
ncbi:DedA family protein [Skermania sp. ID1734]|uniref:DedA family protein n=1 Tax=Skermania sp. ID1734 TaxID=2597516 RepID=UPI00117C270A|nr:DedA family protein [Skermania sp. ID1734]TSD94435.1 DedA family protein [Skermania sp. ID1734]